MEPFNNIGEMVAWAYNILNLRGPCSCFVKTIGQATIIRKPLVVTASYVAEVFTRNPAHITTWSKNF
jgi:hypothetical protein